MGEGRARRETKMPKKYDINDGKDQQKWVFKLLDKSEIKQDLLDEAVYLFWPDDSTWYPAEVRKVDVRRKRADIYYVTTDEEENVDLAELIAEKSIAFRESRPLSHKLGKDEVWDNGNRAEINEEDSEPGEEDPGESDEEAELSKAEAEVSEGNEDNESLQDELIKEEAVKEEAKAPSSSKRNRDVVSSPDEVQGRPKRQITLSTKAQELLSDRQTAQLHMILQGRDTTSARKLESAAIQLEEKAHSKLESDEKTTFPQAEAYEERLLQQIAANSHAHGNYAHDPVSLNQSQFYGRPSLKNVNSAQQNEEVRKKAVEQMTMALEKVSQEEPGVELPNPKEVAENVEHALFKLYGNAGKDYKTKYRSLIFNLRDAKNPELRARVLKGELPPNKLVQLSAEGLASKELNDWREEKEKEAMKNAVLDDIVASKFSTAAALASKRSENRGIDWRDNTLATNSPPRDAPKNEDGIKMDEAWNDEPPEAPKSESKSHQSFPSQAQRSDNTGAHLIKSDSVRSPALKPEDKEGSESFPRMSSRTSTTFDWSSVKANALQQTQSDTENRLQEENEEDAESEEYDPERGDLEDLNLVDSGFSSQFSVAPSQELSERLWGGLLGNACPVPLPISIDYLAGNPAQAIALPPRQVDVKGRVELSKAEEYMKGLKNSRSRIISLASVRLSSAAGSDERQHFEELDNQYRLKQRCAVFPQEGTEYYLMPASRLASGLMEASGPRRLHDGSLLLACVHLKDLQASKKEGTSSPAIRKQEGGQTPTPSKTAPVVQSPLSRNSGLEAQQPIIHNDKKTNPVSPNVAQNVDVTNTANALAEAISSKQYGEVVADPRLTGSAQKSKEEIAQELMVPQGIDLSNLSNLAALLGVSQGLNALTDHQQGASQGNNANQAEDPRNSQPILVSQPNVAIDPRMGNPQTSAPIQNSNPQTFMNSSHPQNTANNPQYSVPTTHTFQPQQNPQAQPMFGNFQNTQTGNLPPPPPQQAQQPLPAPQNQWGIPGPPNPTQPPNQMNPQFQHPQGNVPNQAQPGLPPLSGPPNLGGPAPRGGFHQARPSHYNQQSQGFSQHQNTVQHLNRPHASPNHSYQGNQRPPHQNLDQPQNFGGRRGGRSHQNYHSRGRGRRGGR